MSIAISSGLIQPAAIGGRYVRVCAGVRGFLEGGRFVQPTDPPFLVPDRRAGDLIKAGLVEACERHTPPAEQHETSPAPARAERAVMKR